MHSRASSVARVISAQCPVLVALQEAIEALPEPVLRGGVGLHGVLNVDGQRGVVNQGGPPPGVQARRVPAEADLVCYWFEKAGQQIAAGKATRARECVATCRALWLEYA